MFFCKRWSLYTWRVFVRMHAHLFAILSLGMHYQFVTTCCHSGKTNPNKILDSTKHYVVIVTVENTKRLFSNWKSDYFTTD